MSIIFFSIIFKIILTNNLIIHFKKLKNNSFPHFILDNEIYTNCLNIGTPFQNVLMFFRFDLIGLSIVSKNISGNYNQLNSLSYTKIRDEKFIDGREFIAGDISNETILINDKIEIKNFSFFLINNFSDSFKTTNGYIGLKLKDYYSNVNFNFLSQLKSFNIIDLYIFTIKYKNNDEGEIIFGNLPHEYDNKYYDSKYYKYILTGISKERKISWCINFNNIYYNFNSNEVNEKKINVGLDLNLGGIIAPTSYQNYINEQFFNYYFEKKICVVKEVNISFNYLHMYECEKNIDIKKFNTIAFEQKELNFNFSFNYNEMFIENNNKIYFLVIFNKYSRDSWILGEVFFKKYQLIFEQDKKIIGFYYKIKDKNNFFNFNKILNIILIVIILIFIVIFIYNYLNNNKRKFHANELDENFEYVSDYNNINKEYKKMEMSKK